MATMPNLAPADSGSRISVLLVEDDSAEALRIMEMLAAARGGDVLVSHAEGVESALRMLIEGSYDVVLLDLTLPDGSGIDALLRAKVAAASVPVLVMADEDNGPQALQALRAGAQDYLVKSELDTQLVTRTLRHAVERHRMLRHLTEVQQREHFLATHDSLTGLPNRISFQQGLHGALADAARDGTRVGLFFFDLDGFKAVNDNLGHAAGDALLCEVAQRLRNATRKTDLMARLGGDEFVVAVKRIHDTHAAAAWAEDIRRQIGARYVLDGTECWLPVSIGAALFPVDAKEAEVLTRCADTAMYHAKAQGANRVRFYEDGMNAAIAERFRLVNGLRDAVASGHLLLHFQPQVELVSGELVGAEALLRWRHGDRLVSPSVFVPIAEQTGMAVSLGEWVLREACESAMRWHTIQNRPLRVGVNVSGRQLSDETFPSRVAAILQETGLPPDRLDLELTETSVIDANATTLATLRGLREVGVRIAMDDFGTGYSSLTLLRELPVDALKIDQSFIHGAVTSKRDIALVGAMLRLAHELGITTICEGVETPEQLQLLQERGCQLVQGYLLGKPVGQDEFEEQIVAAHPPWSAPFSDPALF